MSETKDVRADGEDFVGFDADSRQLHLFQEGAGEGPSDGETECVRELRKRGLWGSTMDVKSPFYAEYLEGKYF